MSTEGQTWIDKAQGQVDITADMRLQSNPRPARAHQRLPRSAGPPDQLLAAAWPGLLAGSPGQFPMLVRRHLVPGNLQLRLHIFMMTHQLCWAFILPHAVSTEEVRSCACIADSGRLALCRFLFVDGR